MTPLRATIIIEEETAKRTAEGPQAPGLSIFADGSRTGSGAFGYAVAWKRGHLWRGHKVHKGFQQDAYDAGVQPLPEHWKPLHSGPSPTSALPSTQMPKQPSEGLARMSLAPARSTHLRQGSTSQPPVEEGQAL